MCLSELIKKISEENHFGLLKKFDSVNCFSVSQQLVRSAANSIYFKTYDSKVNFNLSRFFISNHRFCLAIITSFTYSTATESKSEK